MPDLFIPEIERILSDHVSRELHVIDLKPVSGGSINKTFRALTSGRSFFIKLNDAAKYPGMFEAESKGLQLLSGNCRIRMPEVITSGVLNENSFLILEYISPGTNTNHSYQKFASLLASLHRKSNDRFGLDHDNYIGSLKQSNTFHNSWAEFFSEERLSKQLKLAIDHRKISKSLLNSFDVLFAKVGDLFPAEAPALLHGDLWSGNFMTTEKGQPCIYDPAVYFGHREMDLAMTKLFGGFPDVFYEAYNDHFPLEKNWRHRIDLCNLYPLLVHVNLFGGGYVKEVEIILKRYT
jgi:protein-ribulosamine 3-kinase